MADLAAGGPASGRRSDARRNIAAILDAACTVLAAEPSASMARIAAAAGVHRATVHRHFPAREDLLAALHERALAECRSALAAARGRGGSPRAVIADVTQAFLEIGDRYRVPQWHAVFAPREEAARQAVAEPLRQLFADGCRAGELRDDVRPDVLVALWSGAIIGAGALLVRGGASAADLAADVLRLVAAAPAG